MKKKITLLIALFTFYVVGCNTISLLNIPSSTSEIIYSTPNTPEEAFQSTSVAPNFNTHNEKGNEVFKVGLIKDQQHLLDELEKITKYSIQMEILDDYSNISGSEAVDYTNNEDQPLDEIYFRLFPNANGADMLVSDITVNDIPVTPTYEFDNTAIRISLPQQLKPDSSINIWMHFSIKIPRVMGGNYGLFGYFNQILVLDEFYPLIPVFDDDGWNVEAPPHNGDLTYLDVSYYMVQVTAPKSLVLVASGNEVKEMENDDVKVIIFESGPSRDFYLAASENFVVLSDTYGQTKVTSYAPQEYISSAQFALKVATDALSSYGMRFGEYPYTEYDVVSTPMKALGIEYPGIVGIGLSMYDESTVSNTNPSNALFESVIAHETGHQWFYSVVGNNQVNEPWMDEAITQFITALYFLDTHGKIAQENYQRSWYERWGSVNQSDVPIGMSSSEYSINEYSPIIYGRGPIFLKTITDQIGQETMNASLKDYFQTCAWRIGNARTFKQIIEEHCDCDLTPLFEDWVYSE